MRKSTLEKRLARLEAKKAKLIERANASESIEEVRDLNAQVDEIEDEIAETKEEIEAIEEEEARAAVPAGATLVNPLKKVASFEEKSTDKFDSMEYRQAFKAYVQTGKEIPAEYRDNSPANTQTLGATIPTTLLNEFINEIRKVYGNLYAKTRKLNIQGAVKVPIARLQAQFKWVTETTVSPRQDAGEIDEYVEFSYNIGEIRVAQSLLSNIVALDIFEREVIRVMLEAYMQAMDIAIVNGTGNGQPLGIINDPRITKVVEMSAADMSDWKAWRKNFFAKLPLGYRAGEFIFPLSTVDTYLETMSDANGNPVFRQATGLEVNDGDSANPNGRFFGREISLVEPDVVADFDEASVGDVVGIFWQPNEYGINTNLAFGMKRWFDDDRNEWVDKMLTIVDGKVLNPAGFVLIKKK
jgi:HK97 family phage major capsid protein